MKELYSFCRNVQNIDWEMCKTKPALYRDNKAKDVDVMHEVWRLCLALLMRLAADGKKVFFWPVAF